jgi:hypothetical protein
MPQTPDPEMETLLDLMVNQNQDALFRAEGEEVEPVPIVVYVDTHRVILGFVAVNRETGLISTQMADPGTINEFVFDILQNAKGEFVFQLPRKMRMPVINPAKDWNPQDEASAGEVTMLKTGLDEEQKQKILDSKAKNDADLMAEQEVANARNMTLKQLVYQPWDEASSNVHTEDIGNINLDDIGER